MAAAKLTKPQLPHLSNGKTIYIYADDQGCGEDWLRDIRMYRGVRGWGGGQCPNTNFPICFFFLVFKKDISWLSLFIFVYFLATWHVGSYFPNQGSNLCSLQGKCGVITTGPLGKSPIHFFISSLLLYGG